MAVAEKSDIDGEFMEPAKQEWGDFEGRTGDDGDTNWYNEVFHEVREELEEGPEYMMFENMELPREKVLEKYREDLEPGEDEYLKAELEQYPTDEGKFKIMTLEKGRIEGLRVASEGRSHRPVVTTDELPGEGERLASVQEGESETYRVMWEE